MFFQPAFKLLSNARLPRLWGQMTSELYQYLYSSSRCLERTVILMSFERKIRVRTEEMPPTYPHFTSLAQNFLGKSTLSPRSVQSLLDNPVVFTDFQGPIIEHIYDSLLQLYEKYDASTLQGRILQCLGTSYHR